MAKNSTARNLDQFYTNPEYAKHFLDVIEQNFDLREFDHVLEPSAGSGSFYNLLDTVQRIGLDLEPKAAGVVKMDFFDWVQPIGARIATIGNPPFGKNCSLAVKFFNRAAEFSEVIAFIIPRTFRKASVMNRLNTRFHLVHDETVPDNSFIFDGVEYNVPCCAQIWVRKDESRAKVKTYKVAELKAYFEPAKPEDSDFAIQRVGGAAGLIRDIDYKSYSTASHYFFKAHDARVLPIFKKIDFTSVKFNTAGNPSVSPSELVELFVATANQNGMSIEL